MIKIGTNFDYQAPYFLDEKHAVYPSDGTPYYDILRNWSTPIPNGFEVFCDGKWWTYNESNIDGVTGKFRERTVYGTQTETGLKVEILSPSDNALFVPYNSFLTEISVRWRVTFNGELVTPTKLTLYFGTDKHSVFNPKSEDEITLSSLLIYGGDILRIIVECYGETTESSVQFISTFTKYWGCSEYVIEEFKEIQDLNIIENATSLSLKEIFDCKNGNFPYYVVPRTIYHMFSDEYKMIVDGLENTACETYEIENDDGDEVFVVIRHEYLQTGKMCIEFEKNGLVPPSYLKTVGNCKAAFIIDSTGSTSFPSNDFNLMYSVDDGITWYRYTIGNGYENRQEIDLGQHPNGVLWKGMNPGGFYYNLGRRIYFLHFVTDGYVYLYNDITSLINNYGGDVALPDECFYNLFADCDILSAPELPSNYLKQNCYAYTFNDCTSLTIAPELPATTLGVGCYYSMFQGCTSLTTPPELPATTLANNCYQRMFQDCVSLKTAPVLPATTLSSCCYQHMFQDCTSLEAAPELSAMELADYCYEHMFSGCTLLTITPELPATDLKSYCYASMFYNCTSLETAPELPAMELADYCYEHMFSGCTSLTTAPVLQSETLLDGCCNNMFYGCSSLNYIEAMFTTALSDDYTYNWVYGVSPTGTFVRSYYAPWYMEGDSGIPVGWDVKLRHDDGTITDPSYLTFIAESSDISISLRATVSPSPSVFLEYSINNGDWIGMAKSDYIVLPNVGDNVRIRGINNRLSVYYFSVSEGEVSCLGEITSLLNKVGGDIPLSDYTFSSLFSNCEGLLNSPMLPSTMLGNYCYANMFMGCTSLTTAPDLPATTLANNCYQGMFYDCIALTTAPELPSTTLANSCYQNMFNGCKSLVTPPELPSSKLVYNCYGSMFYGCTSLVTAPELPATELAEGGYSYMFHGCTALTTAPDLPATTLANNCYNSMFSGCTSLITAPELPATELAENCYSYMFHDCRALTTAPNLSATTLSRYCYQNMFRGCVSLTTGPDLPATTLAQYCYQNMFYQCSKLNYIKAMFTTMPSSIYTSNWVNGVSPTGTFVKNTEALWDVVGTNGVPSGWTIRYEEAT